ncbi:MAG: adenylosuccinate synthase [Bacteroidales bacterium]|nr:adenylosuccinate synthase [Bacteroidales bacterium]
MARTKVDLILGIQWGDEGKGKFVDVMASEYDIIARFQGGPNAGHTLEFNGIKHILQTIPSGIFHEGKENIIGNGVLIDPHILHRELTAIRKFNIEPKQRLILSDKAHLILPTHRLLDAALEAQKGDKKIGSTVKGIGPAYTDKTARGGLRVGDIIRPDFKRKYEALKAQHTGLLKHYGFDESKWVIDNMPLAEYEAKWFEGVEELSGYRILATEYYLEEAMSAGKRILAEGAQGSLLDVEFGTYPFVTSSNTTASGVCSGLGISPASVGRVYGVFKAYCTRVGSGPFPTELHDAWGERLREQGGEYGSTTGRPRRCGWLDLVALRYTIMLSGVTDLIVTKADVMDDFEEIKVCCGYKKDGKPLAQFSPMDLDGIEPELTTMKGWQTPISDIKRVADLPEAFRAYLAFITEKTHTPVSIISVGPNRLQTLMA